MARIQHDLRLRPQTLTNIASSSNLWPGGTIHVNHEDCPAGEDRRGRLYVTMDDNGNLLGYCHNCGSRGASFSKATSNIHSTSPPVEKLWTPPNIWAESYPMPILAGWHGLIEFKDYFDKWTIHLGLANADGWRYVYDEFNRSMSLLFPCFDKDSVLCGVQERFMLSKEELTKRKLPKVKTYGKTEAHLLNLRDSNTCIIVEDRVSAVRVNEAGYAALCMHGAKPIRGVEGSQLATLFERIVVWYDNDNPSVIEIAESTNRILSLFTNNNKLVRISGEPKYHPYDQVQKIVENLYV